MRTGLFIRICSLLGYIIVSFEFGTNTDLKEVLKDLGDKHSVVNTAEEIDRLKTEVEIYVDSLETIHANQRETLKEISSLLQSGSVEDCEIVFSLPRFVHPKISPNSLDAIDKVFSIGNSRTKIQVVDFLGDRLPAAELVPILKTALSDIDAEVRLKAIQTCCQRKLEELVPQLEEAFQTGGEFDRFITLDSSEPISLVEQILMECGNNELSSPLLQKHAKTLIDESGDSNVAMAAKYFLCETGKEEIAKTYRRELVETACNSEDRYQLQAIELCSESQTIPFETQVLIIEKNLQSEKTWVCDKTISAIVSLSRRYPEHSPTLYRQAIQKASPERLGPLFHDLDKVQLTPELLGDLVLVLADLNQNVSTYFTARRAIANLLLNPQFDDEKLLEFLRHLKEHSKSPIVAGEAESALSFIKSGGRAAIKRMWDLEAEIDKSQG